MVPQVAIVLGIQTRINLRVREPVGSRRDAAEHISRSDLARVQHAALRTR